MNRLNELFGNLLTVDTLLTALAALLALVCHESGHALAAYWLGDPTAKERGRISFNPLRHIDPIGFLMLLVAHFGWAKPVPIDTRYFKNPKRDMALSAAAGPATNFILAFFSMIAYCLVGPHVTDSGAAYWFFLFFYYCALINVGLGVFNLFPIPPLDGSKIFGAFLPDRAYYTLMRYERYGMLILVALLMVGLIDTPLGILRDGVFNGLESAALFLTGLGR